MLRVLFPYGRLLPIHAYVSLQSRVDGLRRDLSLRQHSDGRQIRYEVLRSQGSQVETGPYDHRRLRQRLRWKSRQRDDTIS